MTSGLVDDVWICAVCRSANKSRAKQCYSCRTPRELAAVDPRTIELSGHGQIREVALPTFKSSRLRAFAASLLILMVAGFQVAGLLASADLVEGYIASGVLDLGKLGTAATIGTMNLLVALAALVGWSAWLSRVVTEMPALGLGYPASSGFMAFFENFIPFYNLFRVPSIVRDVTRRLDRQSGRANALIAAAWVGIFGGYLIPRIGGFLSAIASDSAVTDVRNQIAIEGIGTGFVVIGAIFLVWVVWWIEAKIAQRRHAQLMDPGAVTPRVPESAPVAPVAAATGVVPWPVAAPKPASTLTRVAPAGTPVTPLAPVAPAVAASEAAGASVAPSTAAAPATAAPDPMPWSPTTPKTSSTLTRVAPAGRPPAQAEVAAPAEPAAIEPAPAEPVRTAPVEPERVAPGPHLLITVDARGWLKAVLDGQTEGLTEDGVPALADALARAGGSATVRLLAPSEPAAAARDRIAAILRAALVPTVVEA